MTYLINMAPKSGHNAKVFGKLILLRIVLTIKLITYKSTLMCDNMVTPHISYKNIKEKDNLKIIITLSVKINII